MLLATFWEMPIAARSRSMPLVFSYFKLHSLHSVGRNRLALDAGLGTYHLIWFVPLLISTPKVLGGSS